jgi:hypothetical protein
MRRARRGEGAVPGMAERERAVLNLRLSDQK